MTDRERIITAFEKCIRITEDGEMVSDCEHCPYKSKEWEKKGVAGCDEFLELTVEVPWQLADDLLSLVKEQEAFDIDDGGIDFINLGGEMQPATRWKCGGCGGTLAYCNTKPKLKYCYLCGKRLKSDEF